MAFRLFHVKPLPEPMLEYCQVDSLFTDSGFDRMMYVKVTFVLHAGCANSHTDNILTFEWEHPAYLVDTMTVFPGIGNSDCED